MKPKKRYLFFDIDGTLAAGGYENTYIPDSTKLALEKLRSAGHFLCIATGRSQSMAVDYMQELGFHNMVSDGGYGITIDDQLIGIEPLPKDAIIDLVDECKAKGIPWGLSVENSPIRYVPDDSFMKATNDDYMQTKVVPGLDPRNYDKIYKAFVAGYYPIEHEIKALKKLPYVRWHKEYFFVEPSDKAFGIKKILRHFNAPLEDAVVFGDAMNDISMFQDPWTKVAMGNAIPELKKLADYVTTDVTDDGIWNACEHLELF